MGEIIRCKVLADDIKNSIREYITRLKEENQRIPHLVVILVGDNPASKTYVSGKSKDCEEVGIKNTTLHLDSTITTQELISKIEELNNDNTVDGILVQLPLPKHINEYDIIESIDPDKDVDGFHLVNVGGMHIGNDNYYEPCTPKGIIHILEFLNYYSLAGKKAVVIGRSNIVGKPIAKMLLDRDATVTICHSKTKDIISEVQQADIVIAAAGKAKMIKSDWLKQDAVVIDVGINRDENGKLCGDVDLEDVIDKVKYITPVPGGVGLMTRAMLLLNTMEAYMIRG